MPASDVLFDTSPVITVTNAPLQGYSYPVGERVTVLPFFDDFTDVDPALREIVGPGAFPAAASTADVPALGTSYTKEGQVSLMGDYETLLPLGGDNFVAIDFPNGDAAGAIQYAFDLSGYTVQNDQLFFFIRYTDDGEEEDNEDGVFVSLDGGNTWDLLLIELEWTAPLLEWVETTVDLSAALAAAGLDYTDNVVIRVQAQDGSALGSNDGFLVDAVGLGTQPKMAASRPLGALIADGGVDDLGSLPTVATTLSYEVTNTGGFPLRIASVQLAGVSGVTSIHPRAYPSPPAARSRSSSPSPPARATSASSSR